MGTTIDNVATTLVVAAVLALSAGAFVQETLGGKADCAHGAEVEHSTPAWCEGRPTAPLR